VIPRYAVITTYERPQMALDCAHRLEDVDVVLIVDNGTSDVVPDSGDVTTLPLYYVLRDDQQPVNLSQLWNEGLAWCEEDALAAGCDQWDVAILNDDTVPPVGWSSKLQEAMRNSTAIAACTGPANVMWSEAKPVPLELRMTGWAFMLRGESGLRADEQFHWWFGDSDLDYQARELGGMLMIREGYVPNLLPNGYTTGYRQARTHVDADLFAKKWGRLPY